MEEVYIKEEPTFFPDELDMSEKSGNVKEGDSSFPIGAELIKKEPEESCLGEYVPVPSPIVTWDEKILKEESEMKREELCISCEPFFPESPSEGDLGEDVSSTEKSGAQESEETYFGSNYLMCPTEQSRSLSNGAVGSAKADAKWIYTNIKSEEDAVRVLQEFGIVPRTMLCKWQHAMRIREVQNTARWSCQRKGCNVTLSVRRNTWLDRSRIPLRRILTFVFAWSQGFASIKYCEDELNISHSTAVEFNNSLREICAASLLSAPAVIGGVGLTVKIYITCFRKRNSGGPRLVYEQCAYGGVCKETDEVFLYVVPRWDKETLLSCIKDNVYPGTNVVIGKWKESLSVRNLPGYCVREAANHSDCLDYESGARPSDEESTSPLIGPRSKKPRSPYRQRTDSYSCEYIWRIRNKYVDLFEKILSDIAEFH